MSRTTSTNNENALEGVKQITRDMDGFCLLTSILNHDNDRVKEQLQKINVNKKYNTPIRVNQSLLFEKGCTILMEAVVRANQGLVKMLLEHNDTNPNIEDKHGNTALNYAMIELAKTLKTRGFRFTTGVEQRQNTLTNIVKMLLKNSKVDVNHIDGNGDPVLISAINLGISWEVIKELVNLDKLDVNAVNSNGDTALIICMRDYGHYPSTNRDKMYTARILVDRNDINVDVTEEGQVDGGTPLSMIINYFNTKPFFLYGLSSEQFAMDLLKKMRRRSNLTNPLAGLENKEVLAEFERLDGIERSKQEGRYITYGTSFRFPEGDVRSTTTRPNLLSKSKGFSTNPDQVHSTDNDTDNETGKQPTKRTKYTTQNQRQGTQNQTQGTQKQKQRTQKQTQRTQKQNQGTQK